MRRVRTTSSSALCYQGGRDSALWRTLADSGKVDLYLNGEVHDNSRRTDPSSGITQISHGGLFGKGYTHGNTAYLRGEVYGGLRPRLELTLKRFEVTRAGRWRIYQTTPKGRPVRRKRVRWVPQTIGTLTVRPGGAGDGTRKLTQYTGSERCGTKGSFRRDALPLW